MVVDFLLQRQAEVDLHIPLGVLFKDRKYNDKARLVEVDNDEELKDERNFITSPVVNCGVQIV